MITSLWWVSVGKYQFDSTTFTKHLHAVSKQDEYLKRLSAFAATTVNVAYTSFDQKLKRKMNTFTHKLSAVSLVVENRVIGCDVIQPNLFFLRGDIGALKVSKYHVFIVSP